MGLLHAQKGMVWWTICVILPVMSGATLCRPGRQYWDEQSEKCLDCSNCSTVHREVVLRPCQVHQDTQCGPLSALQIDWSFLRPKSSTNNWESSTFTDSEKIDEKSVNRRYNKKHESSKSRSRSKSKHHHHHHGHNHQHHHHHHQSKFFQMESTEESSHSKESPEDIRTSRKQQRKTIKWDNRNFSSSTHHSVHHHPHHHHNNKWKPPQYNSSTRSRIHHSKGHSFLSGKAPLQSASLVKIAEEPLPVSSGLVATSTLAALLQSSSTAAPFSTAEEIVWDWQAIALALAVFACILFFLVAGAYSIHHARQWRRLKDNFEADVEELSTTLSLMTPGSHADANQCIYMEQLLVQKQHGEAEETEQGNVYIDRVKSHPQHACN